MNYVIEKEGDHHWIVKCIEKSTLVEMHRFFRSPENFLYHRGKHGEHERDAEETLREHFKSTPGLEMGEPDYAVMPKAQPKAPR